jgi:ATP synthase protein I
MSLPDPKQKQRFNNALKYSGMAFQMGAIIALGVFGGRKLDQWLGMEKVPIFTLVLSLASVGIAIYLSIKDFLKKK